jgi:hypothetical protein
MTLGRGDVFIQNYSLPIQTKERAWEIYRRWEIIIKLILNGRHCHVVDWI